MYSRDTGRGNRREGGGGESAAEPDPLFDLRSVRPDSVQAPGLLPSTPQTTPRATSLARFPARREPRAQGTHLEIRAVRDAACPISTG